MHENFIEKTGDNLIIIITFTVIFIIIFYKFQ